MTEPRCKICGVTEPYMNYNGKNYFCQTHMHLSHLTDKTEILIATLRSVPDSWEPGLLTELTATCEEAATYLERWRGIAMLMENHRDELKKALAALVSWKDYKDAHGSDSAYQQGKRAAWAKAREALRE